MYYAGCVMLVGFGALVALALLPLLSLLAVTVGLGPFAPAIVTELARGPWLIAASVAGVTCIVVGRVLNQILNPIDGMGRDEQLDAALLAQLVIDRARSSRRSN